MVRKILCYILVLSILYSKNINALVISGNDGSAFITKAEFDALKSSFQSQIDSYNSGIDSKIDSAIASYLSGIKISKQNSLIVLFTSFPQTTIKSLKNTDVAWAEDRQGWNNSFSYFACFNLDPTNTGTPPDTNYNPYFKMGRLSTSLAPVAGKRGIYKDITVNGSKKYQWVGYSEDYKQTNDAAWVFQQFLIDVGYLVNGQYFKGYEYEDANLTSDKRAKIDASKFSFWLTDYNKHAPQKMNRCSVNSSYSYTLKNEYDYIFSDPTAASSTARALRKQDDNEYWSYSEGTYTQKMIYDSATLGSDHDFYSHMSRGLTQKQTITKNAMPNTGIDKDKMPYQSKGQLISAPLRAEKTDVTWQDIIHKDSNRYEYTDGTTSKVLQYYPMTGGVPLTVVKENRIYEWEPYFEGTDKIYLWIRYEPFTGTGIPDSSVIKVCNTLDDAKSTDEAKKYDYLTINSADSGHKKLYFVAPKDGLVFTKWRLESSTDGGGTLIINESKNLMEYEDS